MSTRLKVPKCNGLTGQDFKDWEDKVQAVNLSREDHKHLLDESYYFEHPPLAAANLLQPGAAGFAAEFTFLIPGCPGHPDNNKMMPNRAHTAYNEIVAKNKSMTTSFAAEIVFNLEGDTKVWLDGRDDAEALKANAHLLMKELRSRYKMLKEQVELMRTKTFYAIFMKVPKIIVVK